MSNGKRATQCMWGYGTPNHCNRKTSSGAYCWQHQNIAPSSSSSIPRYGSFTNGTSSTSSRPGSNLSVGSVDEIWNFVDLVSTRTESFEKSERGLFEIAGMHVDFSTQRVLEGEFPELDKRAHQENVAPSWYAASFEKKIVDLLRVRPVSLSVSDIEEIIKAEGHHNLGGVNSRAGNSSIASYALKLAWEKRQLEGTAEQRSENGLYYGGNYEQFVNGVAPVFDKRVEDSFNDHFENWDQYLLFLTGHPPLTSAGLSPRQRRELKKQGRFTAQEIGPHVAPANRPSSPPQQRAVPKDPVQEESFSSRTSSSFAKWKEELRQRNEERDRQEALRQKRENEKRAKIEEVALANGYTYEEWEKKKALDTRHREILTSQREAAARKKKGGFFSLFS